MKTQILALLREQFQGERQDGLALLAGSIALQVSDLEEAQAIVSKLDSEAVSDFVKDYRSEVDREQGQSLKRYKAKLEREAKDKAETTAPKEEEADEQDMNKRITEAIAKAIAPLEEKLQDYHAKEQLRSRSTALEEALKDCGDEHFVQQARKAFGRMSFESEEAFGNYIQELKLDAKEASERLSTLNLGGLRPPQGKGKDLAPTEAELSAILENIS